MMYFPLMSRHARDRRASVSVWIAIVAPLLTLSLGLGVEVSGWTVAQLDVQRQADTASVAGALHYKQTSNAQTAATAAANLAQINGASGSASPNWDPASLTLTSDKITAQVMQGQGVKSASDMTLKVTVRKTVPVTVASPFSSLAAVTVTGTGTAELVSTSPPVSGSNPQVCMLALAGDSDGITSDTDISFSGSMDLEMPTCAVRSDGGITISGSSTINAAAIYAGGSITVNGSASVTGTQHPNAGQIPDPYANNATLVSAMTTANSATGSAVSCSANRCSGPTGS